MHRKHAHKKAGFTLIEILVVIGIIAILAAIVIVAINPARQFAQARNSQRASNVTAILNAVGQNMVDNKGNFTCATPISTTTTVTIATSDYDMRNCIVPTYMSEIPVDPTSGVAWDGSTYNTGYTITRSSSTQRITVCAPGGAEASIASSSAICVTR